MKVKILSTIALLLLSLPTSSIAAGNDSLFINVIKNLKAITLEKGLPDIAVPLWLEKAFEQGGNPVWEVNDCGEGGDGRVAPVCVESIIPQQKGYYLHISFVVADTAGHKIAKPQIMMIYFRKSEGYKTKDLVQVKTLSDATRLYKTDLEARTTHIK